MSSQRRVLSKTGSSEVVDDAKDEAEGESKKLPDGVREGWGRVEEP